MMRVFPLCFRQECRNVALHRERRGSGGQPEPMGDAKDVRVDSEGRFAERYREHDARRLSPDAGERFELLARLGHASTVKGDERTRRGDNILCLRSEEAARLNQSLDIRKSRRRQGLRIRIGGEKRGRRKVHARVGTLRRKNHRNEQFERISIRERGDRVRIRGF